MKIAIVSPKLPHPISTPFGILDKEFRAIVKMRSIDDYQLEIEMRVEPLQKNKPAGIFIKSLKVISEDSSVLGVTTTHLRQIPIKQLIESITREAVYKGTSKGDLRRLRSAVGVSPEQERVAEIVMENPGARHAELISRELGITVQSARNLLTRTRKSGLLFAGRTVEPVTVNEMSAAGAYIDEVLSGKRQPVAPSQRKARQNQKKKTERKGR